MSNIEETVYRDRDLVKKRATQIEKEVMRLHWLREQERGRVARSEEEELRR